MIHFVPVAIVVLIVLAVVVHVKLLAVGSIVSRIGRQVIGLSGIRVPVITRVADVIDELPMGVVHHLVAISIGFVSTLR